MSKELDTLKNQLKQKQKIAEDIQNNLILKKEQINALIMK